jgi:hypothetical protein
MLSLCFPGDLLQAKEFIESRGLRPVRVVPVVLPFFSPRNPIGMMLVEVTRPDDAAGRAALESFWLTAAFPDDDYRAEIRASNSPASIRAGERVALVCDVRNLGGSVWPAQGDAQGRFRVNLADRWLDAGARRVVNALDGRASLTEDLPPGGEAQLTLAVNAPGEPGDYVLEIDMVHEGVTFFGEKGSRPLRLPVRVVP